ncbi:hypothetical protein HMPREF9103_02598 [Lentilactobacillus parafarraginis F0439]|uniref:Uncharacterized protein n=1 Tax=Lentilactobacillus parafarraginis F0439 TaxID=797515 RepID=G9ZS80_9LACO|nr:hypothetical protein HMPREF9103_02598 [Lentilactobacillus parafarraginis F0439]
MKVATYLQSPQTVVDVIGINLYNFMDGSIIIGGIFDEAETGI